MTQSEQGLEGHPVSWFVGADASPAAGLAKKLMILEKASIADEDGKLGN